MGCFLACFGFKHKKKNRRPVKKNLPPEQNHGSYVPLDYDVSIKLDIEENNIKEKPREPSKKSKIKKKVRFNSNVKTYEPIPNGDDTAAYLYEGEDGTTKWDFNSETKSRASLHYQENHSNSTAASYRYKNCRDSYDDEDNNELEFDGNDSSFEEDEDSGKDSENDQDDVFSDDGIPSQENFPSGREVMMNNRIPDEKNQSPEGLISRSHGRDRSRYPYSVLSPVENLAQWKIVKAKAETVQMKSQKENLNPKQEEESFLGRRTNSDSLIPKNMIHSHVSQFSAPTIAVDASFSNWNAREM